jgi:hypothetical protein
MTHPATQQFAQTAMQQGTAFAVNIAHNQIKQLGLDPASTNLLKQVSSQHIDTMHSNMMQNKH